MPIFNDSNEILSTNNIEMQLWKCVNNSSDLNKYPINIVSSDNRDIWAKIYENLKRNGNFLKEFFIFF